MVAQQLPGLLHALLLDGKGGACELTWPEVQDWQPEQGALWLHLNYSSTAVANWLTHNNELPPQATAALIAEDSRPRTTALGQGLLMAMRGVNMNPSADPDELVSLRLFMLESQLITTRDRPLRATEEVVHMLLEGRGPGSTVGCIVEIARTLTEPMEPILDHFEQEIDHYEDVLFLDDEDSAPQLDRNQLSQLRQQLISLRRYLAPQREAFGRLAGEYKHWIDPHHQQWLHEVNDQLARQIEAFDEVRDRAAVVQEELVRRNSEALNNRMYVLSIFTTIFLPLTFITGLLGINVGGIPGANENHGFWVVSGLMIITFLLQLWLLRKKRWL